MCNCRAFGPERSMMPIAVVLKRKFTASIAVETQLRPCHRCPRANICSKLDLKGSNSLLQFALRNRTGCGTDGLSARAASETWQEIGIWAEAADFPFV
jgi:hypothetical protein